jgi:TonB family protein
MIDFLLQLTLPVSLLLILLIAIQQLLLKRLGAATMYALWATVPLLLLISMLSSHVALPVDTLLVQQPALAGSNKAQQLAPVTRIEPRYPIQAAEQGISGFVVLKFDVTAKGQVVNAHVINSEPSQVFDKESLRALQQWQYNATGKKHKDVMVQLDFELDVVKSGIERISITPPAPPAKGLG